MKRIFLVGSLIFTTLILDGCFVMGCIDLLDVRYFRSVIILSESGQSQAVEFKQDENIYHPKSEKIDLESIPRLVPELKSITSADILVSYYSLRTHPDSACVPFTYTHTSFGLGTIKNNGSENIYILTATPKDPRRFYRLFDNLYPADDPWSESWLLTPVRNSERSEFQDYRRGGVVNIFRGEIEKEEKDLISAELGKLRKSLTRQRVSEIVAEYRRLYRPLNDENNTPYTLQTAPQEFIGLTVVAPGETKPIISPAIAPKEYDETFGYY